MSDHALDRLFATIAARKGADAQTSYTAKLLAAGVQTCAKKFGEEAVETVIAATAHGAKEVTAESADVLYHLLVLWAAAGVAPLASIPISTEAKSGGVSARARPVTTIRLSCLALSSSAKAGIAVANDLTAPEASLPILKGASSAAGQLPNLLGVLAGAPAALKAYVRFRAELRNGDLPRHSAERIGLAVAEYYGSKPGLQLHTRTGRQVGLGIDEVARAKRWDSADVAEAALLRYLHKVVEERGRAAMHLHEEAREAGWSDELCPMAPKRS
jgi:phosphoribosyl-ATP pyrophosphohydrolase